MQVYTEGDSFTGAYHKAADALSFVLEIQTQLLNAPWPPELAENDASSTVFLDPPTEHTQPPCSHLAIFHGLRVRAAVHSGIPQALEVYICICFFHIFLHASRLSLCS